MIKPNLDARFVPGHFELAQIELTLLRMLAVILFSLSLMAIGATEPAAAAENGDSKEMSPMLQPWTGPYGGVPPWHLVRPNEFVEAFDEAIAQAIRDIDAITANPQTPTFENTIVAMESAGRTLDRLQSLFGVHASNLNLGPIPDVERVVEPKLAEHQDKVIQNEKLFARIAAVYESDAKDKLRNMGVPILRSA